MSKSFRLFISHSWNYDKAYNSIIEFLNKENINFYNHSVPKDDPIHTNGTDKQLEVAIKGKISGTSCVIILAGVYSSYSKWIKKEIAIAVAQKKPIIAVEPWGATKTSEIVKKHATVIVGWNAKSIANAIKNLC